MCRSLFFQIFVDGRKLYFRKKFKCSQKSKSIDIDLFCGMINLELNEFLVVEAHLCGSLTTNICVINAVDCMKKSDKKLIFLVKNGIKCI